MAAATDSSNDADSRWPRSAMLMWGVFSTRTPAGRLYIHRCVIAVSILILPSVFFLIQHYSHHYYVRPKATGRTTAFLLPFVFAYIVWEFRKYLVSLDELAQRLQLEAMAWTYLTGFVAAALLCGLWLESLPHVDGIWFCPLWFGLLEPVRAYWLYRLARRY